MFKTPSQRQSQPTPDLLKRQQGFNHCLTCLKNGNPNITGGHKFMADGPEVSKRFFECIESFRSKNKPIRVRVGFHYTWSKNGGDVLQSIWDKGLLSTEHQISNQVKNGTYFGRGIYIAENPHAFSIFGDIGILVLYLPGTEQQLNDPNIPIRSDDADSYRGNKQIKMRPETFGKSTQLSTLPLGKDPISAYYDEIVLRRSEQVLPIFAYPRSAVNNAEQLHMLHVQVQETIDRLINFPEDYEGNQPSFPPPRKTIVNRILPNKRDLKYEHLYYKKWITKRKESLALKFLPNGTVTSNS